MRKLDWEAVRLKKEANAAPAAPCALLGPAGVSILGLLVSHAERLAAFLAKAKAGLKAVAADADAAALAVGSAVEALVGEPLEGSVDSAEAGLFLARYASALVDALPKEEEKKEEEEKEEEEKKKEEEENADTAASGGGGDGGDGVESTPMRKKKVLASMDTPEREAKIARAKARAEAAKAVWANTAVNGDQGGSEGGVEGDAQSKARPAAARRRPAPAVAKVPRAAQVAATSAALAGGLGGPPPPMPPPSKRTRPPAASFVKRPAVRPAAGSGSGSGP